MVTDGTGAGGRDTLIFQSYRPGDRPGWVEQCLASTRAWAARCGHAYAILGDELFEAIPGGFMAKCRTSILPATDLGRLLWARRYLQEGWRRVVWVDADVLIFDVDRFSIEPHQDLAFCREIAPIAGSGGVSIELRVNNSVSLYGREHPFLPFYIDACLRIGRSAPGQLKSTALGTRLLTGLHQLIGLPLLSTVGCFDAPLAQELARGDDALLAAYRQASQSPTYAANLCHSFSRLPQDDTMRTPEILLERAVANLLASRGAAVNRGLA